MLLLFLRACGQYWNEAILNILHNNKSTAGGCRCTMFSIIQPLPYIFWPVHWRLSCHLSLPLPWGPCDTSSEGRLFPSSTSRWAPGRESKTFGELTGSKHYKTILLLKLQVTSTSLSFHSSPGASFVCSPSSTVLALTNGGMLSLV